MTTKGVIFDEAARSRQINPLRVVRVALRAGSSVARLLVATEARVAEHVEDERREAEIAAE